MQNSFSLISAIARGVWFIEPIASSAYAPIINKILNGENTQGEMPGNTVYKKQPENFKGDIRELDELDRENYWRVKEFQYFAVHPETGTSSLVFDNVPKGSVAVIPIEGVIMRFDYCGATGIDTLEKVVIKAATHPNISAIVLRAHTPGGSVDYLKEFTNTIAMVDKPVVALASSLCASAGMYIGSAANYLMAENNVTVVGSIGTMMTLVDYSEMYKKEGIKVHEIYADGSELKNKDYHEAMKGNYKLVRESYLNKYRQDFVDTMLEGRGDKIDQSNPKVFGGATMMADEAIECGLVDGIGSLADAITLAAQMATENKSFAKIQKSNTNMFGTSFKAITALKGKAADAITEEDLTAANAELKEKGVEGVMVVNASVIAAAEAQAQDLEAAIGAKNKAEGLLTAANASVKTLETKVQEQEQTIAELNAKLNEDGGEEPKNTDEKDKDIHGAEGEFKPTPLGQLHR